MDERWKTTIAHVFGIYENILQNTISLSPNNLSLNLFC